MKRLIPYLKPYWKQFLFSLVLIIMVAFIVGISPYLEGLIITNIEVSVKNPINGEVIIDFNYIIRIIILLFSLYMIVALSRFTFNFILTRTIQTSVRNLRQDVQKKIHRLPVKYFDQTLLGNTMSRMTTDIEAISNGIQQSFSSKIGRAHV